MRGLPALMGALAATLASTVERPEAVLARFGLVGTWAAACDQPATPHNPLVRFVPQADGSVAAVADAGSGGRSRSTLVRAFLGDDGRLHTTSIAAFADLPKLQQEALASMGVHPAQTNRDTISRAPNGGVLVEDMLTSYEDRPQVAHPIVDGRLVIPGREGPGPAVPLRYRCPG